MVEKQEGPTREDWVEAGLLALVEGGIDAVRVERLATALGVSKGPFYWRFRDRIELLKAIIEFWKRDFTATLIEQSADFDTPRARLEALAELSLERTAGPIDVAQAECALRAWAAKDAMPREAVREVDASRIEHLRGEFQLAGASPRLAEQLARAVYMALLGLYMVRQYTPEIADDQSFRTAVKLALDAAEQESSSGDKAGWLNP